MDSDLRLTDIDLCTENDSTESEMTQKLNQADLNKIRNLNLSQLQSELLSTKQIVYYSKSLADKKILKADSESAYPIF